MLKSIEIDGFKSLHKLKLELKSGLNVFVGPNGSGKSNIMRAFELLSLLITERLGTAVSKMGNIPSTFDALRDKKTISMKLEGLCGLEKQDYSKLDRGSKKLEEIECVEYAMDFRFELEENAHNPIKYAKQNLSLSYKTKDDKPFGEIQIDFLATRKKPTIKFDDVFYMVSDLIFGQMVEILSSRSFDFEERTILDICNRYASIGHCSTLFASVVNDIFAGKPYNIDPAKIRTKEPIGKSTGIEFDGSGLFATIYNLNSKGNGKLKQRKEKIHEIYNHLEFVCPELVDLEIMKPDDEMNIAIVANFKGDKGQEYKLPLNYLSDGTLKWLSLVTAIVTGNSTFSMEDPENSIHIKMLKDFVDILRYNLDESSTEFTRFALITTHSESLIDLLSPEELVLTDFDSGYTTVRRIKNLNLVRKSLNEFGLALGWFHRSDLLRENNDFFMEN